MKLLIDLSLYKENEPKDGQELDALKEILLQKGYADDVLLLHSNFLGDALGEVKVVTILDWDEPAVDGGEG